MSLRCACLLSIFALLLQQVGCTCLPRHNLATTVPLRLHRHRSVRNRGGIALAITRELALHRAWDSKAIARAKRRNKSACAHFVDEAIAFYGRQHDKILRELLLPALEGSAAKADEPTPRSPKGKQSGWDIAMSTESAPLQCAVLAAVPPGTVMVRPKSEDDDNDNDNNPCHYISVQALNSLVRLQAGCLRMLFPNVRRLSVEKLYAHASLLTCLMSTISCSAETRRVISLLLVTAFTAASHRLFLDIFFSILRMRVLWHPQIYSLWSRMYHTPTPMLLITAKKGVEMMLHALSCLDDHIRDWSMSMEGRLLNSDIHRQMFQPRVVNDYNGRERRYETVFNTRRV